MKHLSWNNVVYHKIKLLNPLKIPIYDRPVLENDSL